MTQNMKLANQKNQFYFYLLEMFNSVLWSKGYYRELRHDVPVLSSAARRTTQLTLRVGFAQSSSVQTVGVVTNKMGAEMVLAFMSYTV